MARLLRNSRASELAFVEFREPEPDEVDPDDEPVLGKPVATAAYQLGAELGDLLPRANTIGVAAEEAADLLAFYCRHRDTAEQLIGSGVLVQLYEHAERRELPGVVNDAIYALEMAFQSESLWNWMLAQLEMVPTKTVFQPQDKVWPMLAVLHLTGDIQTLGRLVNAGLVAELQRLLSSEDALGRKYAVNGIRKLVETHAELPIPTSFAKRWAKDDTVTPRESTVMTATFRELKILGLDALMNNRIETL